MFIRVQHIILLQSTMTSKKKTIELFFYCLFFVFFQKKNTPSERIVVILSPTSCNILLNWEKHISEYINLLTRITFSNIRIKIHYSDVLFSNSYLKPLCLWQFSFKSEVLGFLTLGWGKKVQNNIKCIHFYIKFSFNGKQQKKNKKIKSFKNRN